MEKLWRGGLSERVRVGHAWLDDESILDEVVSWTFGVGERGFVR